MNDDKRLLGVVMDPLQGITPKKDSTLAMMLAAQARGWQLVYLEQQGLSIAAGNALGQGSLVEVRDDPQDWYTLIGPWSGPLESLDAVLMRKDPPFDMEYIYSTYILQKAEDAGLLVVNRPQSLRDINEKAFTAWFPECTPAQLISRSHADLKAFLAEHQSVVFKPLDGMGGKSIFVVHQGDINANVILETLTDHGRSYTIAQKYIPEISAGDKRILMINGEPIDYSLARIPAPGESRGNLVMGAKGEGRPLTERDRWICARVGPELVRRGVMFVGIDVIGEYLTEINVTSPTGIRELDRQFGINIADQLIAAVEAKLAT